MLTLFKLQTCFRIPWLMIRWRKKLKFPFVYFFLEPQPRRITQPLNRLKRSPLASDASPPSGLYAWVRPAVSCATTTYSWLHGRRWRKWGASWCFDDFFLVLVVMATRVALRFSQLHRKTGRRGLLLFNAFVPKSKNPCVVPGFVCSRCFLCWCFLGMDAYILEPTKQHGCSASKKMGVLNDVTWTRSNETKNGHQNADSKASICWRWFCACGTPRWLLAFGS